MTESPARSPFRVHAIQEVPFEERPDLDPPRLPDGVKSTQRNPNHHIEITQHEGGRLTWRKDGHARHHHCVHVFSVAGGSARPWTVGGQPSEVRQ